MSDFIKLLTRHPQYAAGYGDDLHVFLHASAKTYKIMTLKNKCLQPSQNCTHAIEVLNWKYCILIFTSLLSSLTGNRDYEVITVLVVSGTDVTNMSESYVMSLPKWLQTQSVMI